jgi:CheY-like chemotaxis protein
LLCEDQELYVPDERYVVLVVDDEAAVRNLIQKLLSGCAATVLLAEDGRQALEISRAHRGRIDVVITDVMMPGMDGVNLAIRMVRERPGIRVLLITGLVTNPTDVEQSGLTVLNKPFSPEQFHTAVANILAETPPHFGATLV